MAKGTKGEIYSWAKSIGFALIIAFICRQFFFTPVAVQGESMMPTFEDNNRVVVFKISEIEHLDMIVFHSPDSEDNYIKRVIGLPGDTIEMKNDQLFINKVLVDEYYLTENIKDAKIKGLARLTEDFGPLKLPKNQYFVMGDNRLRSKDSRIFGFISRSSIIGEVKFRFYPLEEMGPPE
ncbi:signal peptidase I [Mesobacillus harenae]|uniref:signal peptidase I n=1 Tax=Mesobacillus harenae TaxID=2213203 RepID=UPI001580EB37